MMNSRRLMAVCMSLLCLVFLAAWTPQAPAATNELHSLENSFVATAEEATPSVVHLSAERHPMKGAKGDMDSEEFFKQFPFFPRVNPDRFRPTATGSGVIIDPNGYILTNNHLVEESEKITVKVKHPKENREREYEAKLVGRDSATDLAVIKIEPDLPLKAARIGKSSNLKVGQWAIAIGDPFGIEKTVTVGVISGLGRHGFQGPISEVRYQDFIQTDASINPGNSGGPLLNIDGEVIGINTFIQSAGTGIGFATPIDLAKEVYAQLIAHGEVIRGFLGVEIGDLDEGLAAAFNAPDLNGALVGKVHADTPAEKAGLRHGDIVRTVNGAQVENAKMLQNAISHMSPGDRVQLTVLREGKERNIEVELAKFPSDLAALPQQKAKGDRLGLVVDVIPDQLSHAGEKGVFITEIEPDGPADEAGLSEGDIILEVNMQPVENVAAFEKIVAELKPGQWVNFYIRRGDVTVFRALKTSPATE